MTDLDGLLRAAIRAGREEVTADDVTGNGRHAVDFGHQPNGRQSSIGSHFQTWHRRGLIEPTGRFIRSRAPHRKGGAIAVWHVTPTGRAWAQQTDLFGGT